MSTQNKSKKIRLDKLLSSLGIASRRKIKELLTNGRITKNNRPVGLGGKTTLNDKIKLDGRIVSLTPLKKIYIEFHKPIGCSTTLNIKEGKTIMDYIKVKEKIFPVGRLDKETSGLLFLTNDGEWANELMHPKNKIPKTYLVKLDHYIGKNNLDKIEKGINLKDGKTKPAIIKKLKSKELLITIFEGKNRIIRRIFGSLGYTVVFLKRLKYDNYSLNKKLKPGSWRYIKKINFKLKNR